MCLSLYVSAYLRSYVFIYVCIYDCVICKKYSAKIWNEILNLDLFCELQLKFGDCFERILLQKCLLSVFHNVLLNEPFFFLRRCISGLLSEKTKTNKKKQTYRDTNLCQKFTCTVKFSLLFLPLKKTAYPQIITFCIV